MQQAQEKEAATESSTAATQIKNLAFNIAGHAMRIPQIFPQQTLVAHGPNTIPYEQASKQARDNDEPAYRTDLSLTAES